MRTTALAASMLVAASLAGCGKKGEQAADGQTAATEPNAAPAVSSATPPKRKPGLWRQTMSVEGQPTMVSRVCTDEAFEQKATVFANNAMPGACTDSSTTPTVGGWSFHSVCDMGTGGKTVTDGTASGDFASRYEIKATSTTSGAAAPQMNRTSEMTILAEWQGACPADWVAGDMELPGGMRVNGSAMIKGAAAAPSK